MVSRCHKLGFTLVELLVVIGIIALLIGILLPTLSRARDSANHVADASNMRQFGQGFHLYATSNENSAPFGLEVIDDNGKIIYTTGAQFVTVRSTWHTIINNMLAETQDDEIWPTDPTYEPDTQQSRNPIQPFFRSPGTDGATNSIITVAANPIIMTAPLLWNANGAGYGSGEWAPAKLNRLYSDNAVFWDTSAYTEPHEMDIDIFWAWSGVDWALFWGNVAGFGGSDPFARYRNDHVEDPYAGDTFLGNDRSIILPDPDVYGYSFNQDFGTSSLAVYIQEIASPRFRYRDNSVCNVTFADGSVRGLSLGNTTPEFDFYQSEFRRSMLKIKFPTGQVGE